MGKQEDHARPQNEAVHTKLVTTFAGDRCELSIDGGVPAHNPKEKWPAMRRKLEKGAVEEAAMVCSFLVQVMFSFEPTDLPTARGLLSKFHMSSATSIVPLGR